MQQPVQLSQERLQWVVPGIAQGSVASWLVGAWSAILMASYTPCDNRRSALWRAAWSSGRPSRRVSCHPSRYSGEAGPVSGQCWLVHATNHQLEHVAWLVAWLLLSSKLIRRCSHEGMAVVLPFPPLPPASGMASCPVPAATQSQQLYATQLGAWCAGLVGWPKMRLGMRWHWSGTQAVHLHGT